MTIFRELESYVAKKTEGQPDPAAEAEANRHSRGIAGELLNSMAYSGIVDPIRAITQTFDQFAGTKSAQSVTNFFKDNVNIEKPQAAAFGTGDWYAQNFGGAVGMLLPYKLAQKAVGGRTEAMFNRMAGLQAGAQPGLRMIAAREGVSMAAAGMFYGGLLRSSNDENVGTWKFFGDRGVQSVTDGAVFGTLGYSMPMISKGLSSSLTSIERSTTLPVAQFAGRNALTGRLTTGALSAVPAGAVAAEAHALADGRLLPTADEVTQSVAAMALVGTTLSGAHWAGAQRPGTYNTNARHIADRIGLTEAAPVDGPANFKIVKGQTEFNSFVNDVARGNENVTASITVKPRLNTLASGLLGSRFSTLGEAQSLTLAHRGQGRQMTAAELINADLVATCLPLEAGAVPKDVMPARTLGDGRLFVQQTKPGEFRISQTEPTTEARTEGTDVSSEAVALGKARRTTGPQTTPLNSKVDVMGQELSNGSIRMNFNAFGERSSTNIGSATVTTIGVTGNGWPYFEAGVGLKSWTLNGEPLAPGRNYLDIKGGDVLNFNNVLNLRFTLGPKVGKQQTFELRHENLLPEGQRGIRELDAEIAIQGMKLDPNTELVIGADGRPIERAPEIVDAAAPADPLSSMGLAASHVETVMAPRLEVPLEVPIGDALGTIGRRADGRLYFKPRNGEGSVNGTKVPENTEVGISSNDHVVLPNGIKLRISNYGPPPPPEPPRPERAPREGRDRRFEEDGRESRERREWEEEPPPIENDGREGTLDSMDTVEGPINEGPPLKVEARNPAETAPGGNGENPFVTVDNSGPVPQIIVKADGTVRSGATEPRVEPTDARVEPTDLRVEQPAAPVADGTVNGVEVPQTALGLGEAKVNVHKAEGRSGDWTPTMDAMLAKAEIVTFPDGSWYPRFKSEADARTASRYFAKLIQGGRSEHIRFGHGKVKDGYTPVVDVDGVQHGVLTFKPTPETSQIWLGITPPGSTGSVDMVPIKKTQP